MLDPPAGTGRFAPLVLREGRRLVLADLSLAMLAQKLAEAPNPAALAALSEPGGEPYDGPDAEGTNDDDQGGY